MLRLKCDNPNEINERIAQEIKLDGIESQYPFQIDELGLCSIDKKDIHLLSIDEIKQLEEYTPPEIEVI